MLRQRRRRHRHTSGRLGRTERSGRTGRTSTLVVTTKAQLEAAPGQAGDGRSRARRALVGAAERAHTARRDAPHCTDAAPGRRTRCTGASAADDAKYPTSTNVECIDTDGVWRRTRRPPPEP